MIHHVFDIDRTLADGSFRENLAGFVPGQRPTEEQWNIFHQPELLKTDIPYPLAKVFIKQLMTGKKLGSHDFSFITGRRDIVYKETREWLVNHLGDHTHEKYILEHAPLYTRAEFEYNLLPPAYKESVFLKIKEQDEWGSQQRPSYVFYDDDVNILKMYSKYGMVVRCPTGWDHLVISDHETEEFFFPPK